MPFHDSISAPAYLAAARLARLITDLRCGVPLLVRHGDTCHLLHPLSEGVDADALQRLRRHVRTPLRLVLSAARLCYLQRDAGTQPTHALAITLQDTDALEQLIDWGFGQTAQLPQRPLQETSAAERVFTALLKRARCIPAALSCQLKLGTQSLLAQQMQARGYQLVDAEELQEWLKQPPLLDHLSSGWVPLGVGARAHFMAFRERATGLDHVAVIMGNRKTWPDPVPVRLHSSCLTGDIFASMRCDCGTQLHHALAMLRQRGGGVLLYLSQEGRDIGIANKLRSYTMQDAGLNTLEANLALGFAEDERDFSLASKMLKYLQVARIELLTNNPHKVEELADDGIDIVRRTPVYGHLTAQNRAYLLTKSRMGGHDLQAMLAAADHSSVD